MPVTFGPTSPSSYRWWFVSSFSRSKCSNTRKTETTGRRKFQVRSVRGRIFERTAANRTNRVEKKRYLYIYIYIRDSDDCINSVLINAKFRTLHFGGAQDEQTVQIRREGLHRKRPRPLRVLGQRRQNANVQLQFAPGTRVSFTKVRSSRNVTRVIR